MMEMEHHQVKYIFSILKKADRNAVVTDISEAVTNYSNIPYNNLHILLLMM